MQIGPYRLETEIGAGGFGEVYRSTHPVLGTPVALKLLHDDIAHSDSIRARMLREARLTLRLRHAGIVHVYDVGEHDGRLYLVMELLEHGSLRERLRRGALGTGAALALGRALAAALAYAHSQGVLHRDLKPENVLLRADGAPVIADFGLAQPLRDDGNATITQPGAVMGTPAYMAPEQLQGRSTDARSDVYALGVLLFELLVGAPPFGYQSRAAAYHHLNSEAPRLSSIDRRVPPALDELVAAMLAKSPAARPPDMRTVERVLARVLAEAASGVGPPLPPVLERFVPAPVRTEPRPETRLARPRAKLSRWEAVAAWASLAFLLMIPIGIALDRYLDSRPPTPVQVAVLDDLPLDDPRSIVLGENRYTVAGVGVWRGRRSAFINGIVRNDTAQPRANIQVRAIVRDRAGQEVASAATGPVGSTLGPGEVTAFEVLVQDGEQIPEDAQVDFEVRGEATRPLNVPLPLQVSDIAVERRGDVYTVTGQIHSGEQTARYPAVHAVLLDSEGAVLSTVHQSVPEVAQVAAGSGQPFAVWIGELPRPPMGVFVAGEGQPAQ